MILYYIGKTIPNICLKEYIYKVSGLLQCRKYFQANRRFSDFETNEFENFSILIFMLHLSHTFDSYQRIKIYTYSVNDLYLRNIYSNMEFMGILQFADRTLCPKSRLLRSVLSCSLFSYSLLFCLWSQFVY